MRTTQAPPKQRKRLARLPLAAAIYLAMGSTAFAQTATTAAQDPAEPAQTTTPAPTPTPPGKTPVLQAVTVTALKRSENLQKVPVSIQVLGEQKLEQQNVSDFEDFALLMPSVSFNSAGGGVFPGPGFVQVYMRGVASGGDGNHSGSQPSVGMYLDEQPITTIQGALDVHVYDVARIEALAGPQGTLYGASSQAGTIRIITNKPDPSEKSSSYSLEANTIADGGMGYVAEGYTNLPLSDNVALRLVGWSEHKAGYVDNVFGTRTFKTSGITIDNADKVEDNYNESDVIGARAALRIDLNDNWTVTPTIMGQHQESSGSSGFDPQVGDLALTHFYPESADDKWWQAALTVQGRVGNFDLTYAYSNLKRDVDSESDYSDYGFWYDELMDYGQYFCSAVDADGVCDPATYINPSQYIQATDGYRKSSHELRISSPAEDRFRFVAGVFWQDQEHEIFQRYRVDGLVDAYEVPGWADTIWLTTQVRKDHDRAVYAELSYDVTEKLAITGGMRFFKAENGLRGFFGYGAGYSSSTGEVNCFSDESVLDGPCLNLDKEVSENNHLGKVNLTYQVDDDRMVYFTWSEGYRPGGINRRGTLPPYVSDYLTNYEFGWKTTWAEDRLSFNGAIFQEDWKDFQFSYLGQNGLTEIRNAGQARIRGAEMDLNWAATYNLNLSAGVAMYQAKITEDYCAQTDANGDPVPECYDVGRPFDRALAGSRLPLTPRIKGNATARYTWDLGGYEAHWQASVVHVGERTTDLREAQRELISNLDAYTLVDFSTGLKKDSWALDLFIKNVFDERAELGKFSQCATLTCGFQPYTIVAQPRTIGLRFSQQF
jgi:outer membrane receptor protein involved in Fe transport